jgi:hypothetical protein
MPYEVVKVKGGFKVQNKITKAFYSSKPLTKKIADAQKIALEISTGH